MRIPTIVNIALGWRSPSTLLGTRPSYHDTLRGADPLRDGGPTPYVELAIVRSVLRANPKLAPVDALMLAARAVRAASANDLSPEFFAATLLQESAFDPGAISIAGAAGIAQFMPETAAASGVDPFEPLSAIDGAAALLGGYLRAYAAAYDDPYAAALAAYNAGPAAVAAYKGVPPYAETQLYIADVIDRWAKIEAAERPIERR